MLSVVIPAYDEEAMVPLTAQTISAILNEAGIEAELLFVDDGSTDGTWNAICQLQGSEGICVRGLHFSRNFGKEGALFAGLEHARGACCVTIDCDLQHPPATIVEMYRLWEEGYEVVEGVKESRGEESFAHGISARLFYRVIGSMSGMDMSDSSDFKLLDRKVIDALNALPERGVFYRALSHWVGFKSTSVSYRVQERAMGHSKWSTRSLFKYAVNNVTSFSSAPLHVVTALGCLMLVVAVVFGLVSLIQKIVGVALGGFTTVILLLLFSSSVIMISIGCIGYYIERIYEEIKGRPRYIVSATTESRG